MALWADGTALAELGYAKLRALLVYLSMSDGKPLRRQALAAMFWPDREEGVAKQNLRRAIFNLKAALGAAGRVLLTTPETLALDWPGIALDVSEFARPHDFSDPVVLEQRAALYQGELAAGLFLPECPEFEDWLQAQRESLHRRALLVLDWLAQHHAGLGNFSKALPFAQRYTELDPLDEKGQRRVMHLHASLGQESAALAQYDACQLLLKSELGVLPEKETQQLANSIRKGIFVHQPAPVLAGAAPAKAERRQVSILFCELPVAMFDDPEEAMDVLREPQDRCAKLIRSFGGHIVQTHGGGLLAYFGYPQAREDAARRAVQAALRVSHERPNGLAIRACVHTGLIVTDGNDGMPDTVGKSSTLAMHLRHGAAGHAVVISEDCQRIVEGYFEYEPLGKTHIAGFSSAVALFAVTGETGARTRLQAARQFTPFTGRQQELAMLSQAWSDAVAGQRRAVLIQGDAGLGKSRLLQEFVRQRGIPTVLPELQCFPEHSQSPFHPLIAMLEAVLQCLPQDTPSQKFERLVVYLENHFTELLADAAPLFAELLSLPLRAPYCLPDLPPSKRKEQTVALVLQWLRLSAIDHPLLVVVEDVHWADPSSLELFKALVEDTAACPLLLLCSARPGFAPDWHPERYTHLLLNQLALTDALGMISCLDGNLSTEQADHIASRTDGIPLFIEEMFELVRKGVTSGIPATLQDLLAARMDTLGAAKLLAQQAAALGREFRLDWLQRIFPHDRMQDMLASLQAAGVVLLVDSNIGQFKHALIQEAAYMTQTRQDRAAAHQRIANLLQRDEADIVTHQPELLAQHLAAAGEHMPAVEFWLLAGQRAVQHSAMAEAMVHYQNGLALLSAVAGSSVRTRLEAALHLNLGMAQILTQGYGSLNARAAFNRAYELGASLGDDDISFTALWGEWLGASSCEDHAHASELANRLLLLAQSASDPVQQQQAYLAIGDGYLWRGQQDLACQFFTRGLALYHPEQHAEMVRRVGENVAVSIGSQYVWSLWLSGKPEQASDQAKRTLELAQQLNHPYSLGYIYTHQMILARWRGDIAGMRKHAEQALALAQRHGFHIWLVSGLAFQGLSNCYQGDAQGIGLIRQSIGIVHEVMSGVEAFFIAALGEGLGQIGLYREAVQTLDAALVNMAEKDNPFWKSETLRLKGEFLLKLAPTDTTEAEHCFEQALATSRRQQALALELRSTCSLAKLWQQQGKVDAARSLLEGVCAKFTEGFTEPDMLQAHMLQRK